MFYSDYLLSSLSAKKVLSLGVNGQLARALKYTCPQNIDLLQVARDRFTGDCWDVKLSQLFNVFKPDCIINAAAYTDVEKAEVDPEAFVINAELVMALGRLALKNKIPLLHMSTDYVFSGLNSFGYHSDDMTAPVNKYGQSKLAGEQALKSIVGLHGAIVRTSWLYSPWGHNFLLTMLRLFKSGAVNVVDDQYGCPTSAIGLARSLWLLALHKMEVGHLEHKCQIQILHWSDQGKASWFEFAQEIANQGLQHGLFDALPQLTPIASADFPTKALRPQYSLLLLSQTFDDLGVIRLSWQEALWECISILKGSPDNER